jgi:hypothetical protein
MRPIIEAIGSRRFRHRSRWTIRSIVGLTLRIRCVLRRAPRLALSLPSWTIRVRLIYVRPRSGLRWRPWRRCLLLPLRWTIRRLRHLSITRNSAERRHVDQCHRHPPELESLGHPTL